MCLAKKALLMIQLFKYKNTKRKFMEDESSSFPHEKVNTEI